MNALDDILGLCPEMSLLAPITFMYHPRPLVRKIKENKNMTSNQHWQPAAIASMCVLEPRKGLHFFVPNQISGFGPIPTTRDTYIERAVGPTALGYNGVDGSDIVATGQLD
jgi:hypothetical protein